MDFNTSTLPSRAIPYATKEFTVEKFRPKHLIHVSEAITLDSVEPMIKAVQQVISVDVKTLTPGDFYYIVTWLRMFSRSIPLQAEWKCEGSMYVRKDNGIRINESTLRMLAEQYYAAEGTEEQKLLEDPEQIHLDVVACAAENSRKIEFADFNTIVMPEHELDERLSYPKVQHLAEYIKFLGDTQMKRIAGPAMWIKEGVTLQDKIDVLFEQDDMTLFDIATQAEVALDHGVLQRVVKTCETCGQEHAFVISIDASSFFA